MMNYIAFRFSEYMLRGPMKDPTEYTPKTPVIADTAKLYHFFQDPIRFHLGFFISHRPGCSSLYLLAVVQDHLGL